MRKTLIQVRGLSTFALIFWIGVAGRAVFDLTLAGATAPPPSTHAALSLAECVRSLTTSEWGKLNLAHQKWIPVRSIGASWDALIQPRRMTHWRGRTVRLHSIGGSDLIGRVTAIQVDPSSDPQSFLRVTAFQVQPLSGGDVVSRLASRITRIDVLTTMVPKEAFVRSYGASAGRKTDYVALVKSQGKQLALYTKSGVFYEQAVVEGRLVSIIASPRDHLESKLLVEVARGQRVEIALSDVKAYVELGAEGK